MRRCGRRGVGLNRAPYPLTVGGLIYASSMVLLDSTRNSVRVPVLSRWLLGVGIVATLTAPDRQPGGLAAAETGPADSAVP